MKLRNHLILTGLLVSATIVGCASKPPQYESISSSANPNTEIERTEEMLREARQRQVDVLSPDNYADARRALEKAKTKRQSNASNDKVLTEVAYARGWLDEANAKALITETAISDIRDARAGALRAGAPQMYSSEWKKYEKELRDVTSSVEKGNLTPAEKKGNDLVTRYRDLEIKSVRQAQLGEAAKALEAARKDKAQERAPKSYEMAFVKFRNAERIIERDPRSTEIIQEAARSADMEARHLTDVMRKVNAGNTEDLVLTAERQRHDLKDLRRDYASTESELDQTSKERDRLQQTYVASTSAEKIRRHFKPNEAEVYTQNGKVMVRLKGLQFPTGKDTLGPRNQALLNKIESALEQVDPAKITIEGHTDNTGNADINTVLSQKRAQAVEEFLQQGNMAQVEMEAIGKGASSPIGDNKTPAGRAENRRIDLVIETN